MNDYISRAKAIEEINKYHMTSGVSNQGTWNECVDVIAHTISEFPSADVREKEHIKELLDRIRAEIDEQYDRVHPYNIDVAQGLEMALDILDNIGKAESEDT